MRLRWACAVLLAAAACSEEPGGGGGTSDTGGRTGNGGADTGVATGTDDSGANNGGADTGVATGTDDSGANNGGADSGGNNGGGDGATGGRADGGVLSLSDVPFFGSDGSTSGGTGCVAAEVCDNGLDDNCDGRIDENCPCSTGVRPCYTGFPAQAGVGVCYLGTQTCTMNSEDFRLGPCENEGRPQEVVCGGGMDYHCNGIIDEGCNCRAGETRACYTGPASTRGVGLCRDGMQACVVSGSSAEWGPCMGEVLPAAMNTCDGQDHLCNGQPESGCTCVLGTSRACYDGPMGTSGVGLCAPGMQSCVSVNGAPAWGMCNGQVLPAPNTCDGMDRMCTGNPMTGCDCTIGTSRPCYDGPMGTAGVGVCRGGMQQCMAGAGGMGAVWGACDGQILPSMNTCDGVDRMCNNNPLAGCACTIGTTRPCYTGPAATRGIGVCSDGMESCVDLGGGMAAWSGMCAGQVLPGPMEICGNNLDDDCSGPPADEGCAPTIMCPADATVLAGQPITLTANASSSGRTIASWAWNITNAPMGGIGTPNQWAPAPPSAATEVFTPFIVGVYTIRITATDSGGASASCETRVTAQGHGLRATLTWDGAGDVDLHVHNGNVSPWFNGDDCFYGNCTPRSGTLPWDGGGGNNPRLDFDNVTANGPENTSLDVAVVGRTYTVAVHNYFNAAGRRATVQIFCGGATSPTAMFTSNPLSGTGGSNCTTATFWKIARVVFTAPDVCTVTQINTYGTSAAACTGF